MKAATPVRVFVLDHSLQMHRSRSSQKFHIVQVCQPPKTFVIDHVLHSHTWDQVAVVCKSRTAAPYSSSDLYPPRQRSPPCMANTAPSLLKQLFDQALKNALQESHSV